MPSIKILPPKQLPNKGFSEQKFKTWTTELEVWLGADNDMARFMQEGQYSTWEAEEVTPGRILTLHADDQTLAEAEDTAIMKAAKRTEILAKRKRQLKTFLSQVAKVITDNHYNVVMR